MREFAFLWMVGLAGPVAVFVATLAIVLASLRRTARWGARLAVAGLIAAVPTLPLEVYSCAITQAMADRGEHYGPAELWSPAAAAATARWHAWLCAGGAVVSGAALWLGRRRGSRSTP